jgi:hypothetical protein
MGLSYRPAGLHGLAGRYDSPMPELTLSPSHGWIYNPLKVTVTDTKYIACNLPARPLAGTLLYLDLTDVMIQYKAVFGILLTSVGDPYVFGPSGSASGSISHKYGSGSGPDSGSFHH